MRVRLITTIFTVLSALFVAIRLFTRVKLVKKWGYNDLLIIFAWICSAVFFAFIFVGEFIYTRRYMTYYVAFLLVCISKANLITM